ncbi:MAG: hypothetical protein GZ087_11500 [Flavobacterium sp.]|nr:hypothetical protein [Flavobacterium sp.]
MKKLNKFIFQLILITSIFIIGCEKDKTPTDCGCDSKIVFTIEDTKELTGTIFFKKQLDPNDNFYNNKFWIGYTDPNCSTCTHSLIVCNEDLLAEFNDLRTLSIDTSVKIKFAGHIRETCEKIFHPSNSTYNIITLTKIEKQ